MLKYKKYASSFCLILFLSLAILLFTGFKVCAESTDHNVLSGSLPAEKTQAKKQNYAVADKATKTAKTILPGKGKETSTDADDDDEKIPVDEEQDLMENALEILEVADAYWKSGDLENTLNELDKAYALLLDTNGEAEISRQKDDLRLLISRRLLAVYSSKQTKTNGKASEIPLLMNADVEKEIRSFQGYEREFFMSSYERSGMFKDIIVGELKKAGVPEEFFWLPLVESGFKVSAYSRARALGLWQFIPSTGYKFGLTRDEWMDERMDVLKSTHAAIAYLKELHGMFGDWLTVLAAYNCGEGRVLRVISRQHISYFDHFWDLYSKLPNETARYVPRFLATLHIVKNPEKYGFNLPKPKESLLNYETAKVNKMMKLSDVASKMEVPEETLCILNAELRSKMTPDREYAIKIPQESLEKFNLVYNDIPAAEKPNVRFSSASSSNSIRNTSSSGRPSYIRHRVRPGETVASIAKRYRVSKQTIYKSNRINKKQRLAKGRIIQIPINRVETASVKEKSAGKNKGRNTAGMVKIYKVKKGDSLAGIANRFNVSIDRLKKANNLKINKIQAGRRLKVPCDEMGSADDDNREKVIRPAKSPSKTLVAKTLTTEDVAQLGTNRHIVTKGENLAMIARKYKTESARLKQLNNLTGADAIAPGQVLVVKQ
jgi:membrane-bound lytic murein transglycosylase D